MSVTTITASSVRGGLAADIFTADPASLNRASTSTIGARDTSASLGTGRECASIPSPDTILSPKTVPPPNTRSAPPLSPERLSGRLQPKPTGHVTRRRANGLGPLARPLRAVPAPSLGTPVYRPVQACTVAEDPTPWQLTERGVALVAIAVLMIVVAALTVVGLTAVRVTGDHYQAPGAFRSAHS